MKLPRVAVLTGAGISTGAGIPDFRGPNGVWTKSPERAGLLDIDAYLGSAVLRADAWKDWRDNPAWTRLVRAGFAGCVLTQNFDGLHQAAGLKDHQVVELHGTIRTASCRKCHISLPTEDVFKRLKVRPDPVCSWCGGILKVDVVYFGETLPAEALDRAVREAETCDFFVAIGTTLSVYPVAGLAASAVRAGAKLIIVNDEPTNYDDEAHKIIREPIDEAVPALVADFMDRL
jgi:NAD-dependent deacetylase